MKDLDPQTLWPHEVAEDWIGENIMIIVIIFWLLVFLDMMMIYLGWVFAVWEF